MILNINGKLTMTSIKNEFYQWALTLLHLFLWENRSRHKKRCNSLAAGSNQLNHLVYIVYDEKKEKDQISIIIINRIN